jgi:hypothetical protein
MRRSHGVSGPERPYTADVKEIGKREETQGLEAFEPSDEECELCGTEMFGLHCKLICPNCGYRRDCSDP